MFSFLNRPSNSYQMVADEFDVPVKHCSTVSQYVFENCAGQPLHTLQLLRALKAHQLIEILDFSLTLDTERADKILQEAGRDDQD